MLRGDLNTEWRDDPPCPNDNPRESRRLREIIPPVHTARGIIPLWCSPAEVMTPLGQEVGSWFMYSSAVIRLHSRMSRLWTNGSGTQV